MRVEAKRASEEYGRVLRRYPLKPGETVERPQRGEVVSSSVGNRREGIDPAIQPVDSPSITHPVPSFTHPTPSITHRKPSITHRGVL
ncbi:putative transposase [Klebsiella pneumoniae]|nr:putative transposase [Klebsiella pneumoniae]